MGMANQSGVYHVTGTARMMTSTWYHPFELHPVQLKFIENPACVAPCRHRIVAMRSQWSTAMACVIMSTPPPLPFPHTKVDPYPVKHERQDDCLAFYFISNFHPFGGRVIRKQRKTTKECTRTTEIHGALRWCPSKPSQCRPPCFPTALSALVLSIERGFVGPAYGLSGAVNNSELHGPC